MPTMSVAPYDRTFWQRLHADLGAMATAILHPRTTASRIAALWHILTNGGVVVDTPDPRGRWALLLRTSIQLDGDVTSFIERRWLEAAYAAELHAHAQAHLAVVALRVDPLDDLRGIERATWYVAVCVSLVVTTLSIVRGYDRMSPTSAGLVVAPLVLRWAAPRLLYSLTQLYWVRLSRGVRATMQADLDHLRGRRSIRHSKGK